MTCLVRFLSTAFSEKKRVCRENAGFEFVGSGGRGETILISRLGGSLWTYATPALDTAHST